MRFFVFYALILVAGLAQSYSYFRSYFSEEKVLSSQVNYLSKENQRLAMESQFAQYQLAEFRQEVAQILPNAVKQDPYQYATRNLASVVGSAEPMELNSSASLLRKGKYYFEKKSYEEAIPYFSQIFRQFPESIQLPEALFLMAESYYQVKDYSKAMDSIEVLMQQFPEHILTGYSLIRLGKIYEKNDLPQDARLVYQLVLERFDQKKLREQAQIKLQGIDL